MELFAVQNTVVGKWQTNARVGGVGITIWAAVLIDAGGHHPITGAKFITL